MLTVETMKFRLQEGTLTEFDLVFWTGKAKVVAIGDDTVSLLVRGKRANYTWDRVRSTWERLFSNQLLSVDELGGGHDAVGLVSLFAAWELDEIAVDAPNGVLRVVDAAGKPVRSFPQTMPVDWKPLERKIAGN
jgi:hypothetical protein